MSNIEFPFFAFPQAFIYSEDLRQLPPNAKLLYMLLLDRVSLSERNTDTFSDENGVFVFFTDEEAVRLLNCSRSSVTRAKNALEEKGFIVSERQGGMTPNKIRVVVPDEIFTILMRQNEASIEVMRQKEASGRVKLTHYDASKRSTNQTYNIHTYNNQTYPLQAEDGDMAEIFKDQVDYDLIVCNADRAVIDELIMVMSDMYSGKSKEIRIGGNIYAADYVRKRLRKIDSESIMDVYYKIRDNRTAVRDHAAYVRQLLFNAPATVTTAATLDYGHDFNQ